jgi:hypothetical protein
MGDDGGTVEGSDKPWRSLHWNPFASVSHHEDMAFKCIYALMFTNRDMTRNSI